MTGTPSSTDGQDPDGQPRAPVRAAPNLVERATALRGQSIAKPPASLQKRRRTTEHELFADSDIPYGEFGKALSRVLAAFVERQDRAGDALLLRLNGLQYRMDDAEYALRGLAEEDRKAKEGEG